MTTTVYPDRNRDRLATSVSLLPAIVRSGALTPIAAAGVLSVGAVVAVRLAQGPGDASEWALRAAAMLLAASLGSCLDDPTEDTVAAAPTPLPVRRILRLAPATLVVTVTWIACVAAAGRSSTTVGLTLMLGGLGASGVAVAAIVVRRLPQRGTLTGASATLVVALSIMRLPDRWTMLPDPATGLGPAPTLRWVAAIAVGITALAYSSRDPGRRADTARAPTGIG